MVDSDFVVYLVMALLEGCVLAQCDKKSYDKTF